ncbi:RNA polymerase sigma factor [Paraflavitalea pollutisoli]|uniref:RNA polymerase sigma factor n=1 Tax=Paraflavitalea pollutisoli TaxID=3034143 RepID=UPI0023EBAFA8|nr:sigma-70 family RNA polymerase sigma factor [Paraflavitalea sp. H1-2-19X]
MNKPSTTTQVSDQSLIDRIHQKDDNAFRLLYEKYWKPLLHFASHFIPDEDTCQEVVQELFITLHLKRQQLNVNTSVSAYLYGSLRNRIYNYIRDQSVYNKHVKGASRARWMTTVDNSMQQTLDMLELHRIIEECLTTMPNKYREVYVLHRQYGYTLKKTSSLLQRPVDTVEKQFRRVMVLLRTYLRRQEALETRSSAKK